MTRDAGHEVLELRLRRAPAAVRVLPSSDNRGGRGPDRRAIPIEDSGILVGRQGRLRAEPVVLPGTSESMRTVRHAPSGFVFIPLDIETASICVGWRAQILCG